MKKLIIVIALFSIVSCSDTGKKNLDRVKSVKIGMTTSEVRQIMGDPKDTFSVRFGLTYCYEAPFGYSDDIRIVFDTTTNLVQLINEGH